MKWAEHFMHTLFPIRCVYCGKIQSSGAEVCTHCEVLAKAVQRERGSVVDTGGRTLSFVDAALAPFLYIEPVKGAILRLKFRERPDIAQFFSKELISELRACKGLPLFDIIIPVPSGKLELRKRGYSVPLLLAKNMSKQSGIPFNNACLAKPKDTPRQMKLSGAARRANILGAFSVTNGDIIRGKHILLVDDVITTGATVNECAKMLMVSGALSCHSVCIAIASITK